MDTVNNPDLLPPGLDPNDPRALKVPALTTLTPPQVNSDTGVERHYWSSMSNVSIHRPDGTRLSFLFHHFCTSMSADIAFLDAEIAGRHPYIRNATDKEVEIAMMQKDPRGTIKRQVTAEVEAETKSKVEAEIRARLQKELGISDEAMDKALATPVPAQQDADAAKLAGTVATSGLDKLRGIRSGAATIRPVSTADIKDNSK